MMFSALATIPPGHPKYPKAKWEAGETSLAPMRVASAGREPTASISIPYMR